MSDKILTCELEISVRQATGRTPTELAAEQTIRCATGQGLRCRAAGSPRAGAADHYDRPGSVAGAVRW